MIDIFMTKHELSANELYAKNKRTAKTIFVSDSHLCQKNVITHYTLNFFCDSNTNIFYEIIANDNFHFFIFAIMSNFITKPLILFFVVSHLIGLRLIHEAIFI